MKKNLRIVSAAAAALLAVAPVAAAAVVSPATTQVAHASSVKKGDKLTISKDFNAINNAASFKKGEEVTVVSAGFKTSRVKAANGKVYVVDTKTLLTQSAPVDPNAAKFAIGDAVQTNKRDVWAYTYNEGKTGAEEFSVDNSVDVNPNDVLNVVGENKIWKADANNTYSMVPVLVKDKNGKSTLVYINQSQLKKAAAKNTADVTTPSTTINAPSTSIFDPDGNVDPAISAVAASDGNTSALVGQVNVSLHGKNYVALLHGAANTKVYRYAGKNSFHEVSPAEARHLHAGVQYYARLNDVTVNLGNDEAGKTEKFTLTKGWFEKGDKGTYSDRANSAYYRTVTVKVDKDGIAHLGNVFVPFNAYDANNMQEVHIYSEKTGNVVTSGSVDLHAVNGQLNVEAVRRAINHEYVGRQVDGGVEQQPVYFLNNLRDQLNKANIKVDGNTGYFKAPSQFTVNVTYKSVINGAEATIPVTVNVDNAAASTTTDNEQTTTKTIMHIATIYDKNGKATNEPVLRAYNSVSVVSTPVELKDASGKSLGKFYKLAGKDEYIKVGNIDGTSRSLKHNSYVYKANGKAIKVSKKHHRVLKSGSSVTTYGKSFKNDVLGTQVYRIGKNQYVKVANFR